jgi:hypothetical protein
MLISVKTKSPTEVGLFGFALVSGKRMKATKDHHTKLKF